jgi:general stress protein YciG
MSARIAGIEPPTTNDKNPQASENIEEAQHLAPDLPPRPADSTSEVKPRRPRGFAAMDRKLVSEIARKGGKAAHSAGTAHEFTSDEARDAGRKGGRATHAKRREAQGGEALTEREKTETT